MTKASAPSPACAQSDRYAGQLPGPDPDDPVRCDVGDVVGDVGQHDSWGQRYRRSWGSLGLAHLAWVVTAHTLATAISTPVWGKVGDLYGRKKVFLTAIVVFVAGSVLSGAAQSMIELITFRAVQGLGSGVLAVGAFALIGDLVPPRERGRYQGMTASITAIGTIGGPLLGGVVTTNLDWRWAFYINVPLGIVAFVWCKVMLRLPAKRTSARIDWLGLLDVSITGLVLVTTWGGHQYSWTSVQVLGLGAVAVAALIGFIIYQQPDAEPVLNCAFSATATYRWPRSSRWSSAWRRSAAWCTCRSPCKPSSTPTPPAPDCYCCRSCWSPRWPGR